MADEIPQWAKERAVKLANTVAGYPRFTVRHLERDWVSLQAFASYIAEHEEPPVDPVEVAAKAAVFSNYPEPAPQNEHALLIVARDAVRRGMELEREKLNQVKAQVRQ